MPSDSKTAAARRLRMNRAAFIDASVRVFIGYALVAGVLVAVAEGWCH